MQRQPRQPRQSTPGQLRRQVPLASASRAGGAERCARVWHFVCVCCFHLRASQTKPTEPVDVRASATALVCVLSSSSQYPPASACTPCEISETPDTLWVKVGPNTATGFFASQYPAYSKAYDGTRVVYASLHAPCGAVVTASLLLPQPPTPTLLGPPLASIVQKGGGKRTSAFPPHSSRGLPRSRARVLTRAVVTQAYAVSPAASN